MHDYQVPPPENQYDEEDYWDYQPYADVDRTAQNLQLPRPAGTVDPQETYVQLRDIGRQRTIEIETVEQKLQTLRARLARIMYKVDKNSETYAQLKFFDRELAELELKLLRQFFERKHRSHRRCNVM